MRLKVAPWIILTDVGDTPGPNQLGETQYADGYLPDDALLPAGSLDTATCDNQQNDVGELAHLNYMRNLERKQDPRSEVEKYGSGYQDYLQIPLQPLTDNLESMTYEVFEKDPVKYDLYEQAIRKALRDWADQRKTTSGPDGKVVVVVAGAGRGPLVTRALKASKAENVSIDMWAVEKNPNAYVLLLRHNRERWKRQVRLEKSDMRSWKGPWRTDFSPTPAGASRIATTPPEVAPTKTYYAVDILISELLGSFGDNELSPECLDGILHVLAKPHGISIPRSYTAWLTPIAAPRLHADVAQRAAYDSTAPETPAVVWLHQIDYLSSETGYKESNTQQEGTKTERATQSADSRGVNIPIHSTPLPNVLCAWEFKHGSEGITSITNGAHHNAGSLSDSNAHNGRFVKLTFRTRHRAVCHGLGGYFESVLYPGVELSTNPNTVDQKSKDMISWFPIFFPLKVIADRSTLNTTLTGLTDTIICP